MTVLQAIRRSPSALARSPALFIPMSLLFLLQAPQLALQSTNPLVSSVYSLVLSLAFLVVIPFVQGGMIGMAHDSLSGYPSNLSHFVEYGRDNYVSLLVAYLIILAVNFVLGFAFVIIGGVGFVLGFASTNTIVIAIVAVVALLFLLIYLVFAFFIQFYAQAIVVDGHGAVDGLKHSYRVVRANVLTTIGYMVLVLVFGLLVGAIYGAASLLLSPQAAAGIGLPTLSLPALVAVALVLTLFMGVASTFFLVFSVAFYDELTSTHA